MAKISQSIRRAFIYLIKTMAYMGAFVLLYLVAAFTLSAITVNQHYISPAEGVDIYILSNGVHTDLVFPIKSDVKDWGENLPIVHTLAADSTREYVAFGWGDKGFYLETPTWADLKFSTAFKAAFWLGTSAMHVSYYSGMKESPHCKKVRIDNDTYLRLVNYIQNSFQTSSEGAFHHIPGHSYDNHDAFYEARGKYNLFFTCNTWTNNALKSSGLKACYWTPFDTGILGIYDRD